MARSPFVHDRVADDDEILRDGGRRLVPLMLKDAAGRDTGEVVQVEPWQADTIYAARLGLDDAAALHRPGPRYCTDQAALDAKAKAYADGVAEMTTAWQRKPVADANSDPSENRTKSVRNSNTGVGSGELRGQQPGDQCTVNGAPGHLNHRLECIPDERQDAVPRTMTADAAQRIRDAAWLESVQELEMAWKKPLP